MRRKEGALTTIAEALLDLLAPPLCPLCGLDGPADPAGLCAACMEGVRRIEEPYCTVCALPFEGVGPSHPCSLCSMKPPPFASASAFGVFDGALRKAVHSFKYSKNLALERTLEEFFLTNCLERWGEGDFDAVVPVPCHPDGLRRRGFDLPALLSRRIAGELGAEWRPTALAKADAKVRMAGLGLKERKRAVVGLYLVREKIGGRVLLVDDVITSTVTVRAAARALRRGGAEHIEIAALARTPMAPRRTL